MCRPVKIGVILYFYISLTEVNNAKPCSFKWCKGFKCLLFILTRMHIRIFQKWWIFPILLWKNFKYRNTLHLDSVIINNLPKSFLSTYTYALFSLPLKLYISWHFSTNLQHASLKNKGILLNTHLRILPMSVLIST